MRKSFRPNTEPIRGDANAILVLVATLFFPTLNQIKNFQSLSLKLARDKAII